MPFKVMSKRCDECLYGPNKIVSNERRRELQREMAARDRHFSCHKATIAGVDVCCHGCWTATGGGQLGRIAGRLGAVEFVDESEL
jgi:hypothetical protein